jgi:hypothetical protein
MESSVSIIPLTIAAFWKEALCDWWLEPNLFRGTCCFRFQDGDFTLLSTCQSRRCRPGHGWGGQSPVGPSPQRPGFGLRPVSVGFVVDELARGNILPRVLRFSPRQYHSSSAPQVIRHKGYQDASVVCQWRRSCKVAWHIV